jgi:hypothetical protein
VTFQAYLDTIKSRTGKTPEDFRALANTKGLRTRPELMNWLKSEYGLGYGHANVIAGMILHAHDEETTPKEDLAALFKGARSRWRGPYDALAGTCARFGSGFSVAPTSTYISLLREGRKFGIVQPSTVRLDIGIKLKGAAPVGRFEAAGRWNAMVTHRVRISTPSDVDDEVVSWLRKAFEAA